MILLQRKEIKMSNSNNIISNFNHTLKVGDQMIKMYGNKIVKLEFVFNKDGDDLKTIINRTFKEELYKKKLLFGGVLDELQKIKNDGTMQSQIFQTPIIKREEY